MATVTVGTRRLGRYLHADNTQHITAQIAENCLTLHTTVLDLQEHPYCATHVLGTQSESCDPLAKVPLDIQLRAR